MSLSTIATQLRIPLTRFGRRPEPVGRLRAARHRPGRRHGVAHDAGLALLQPGTDAVAPRPAARRRERAAESARRPSRPGELGDVPGPARAGAGWPSTSRKRRSRLCAASIRSSRSRRSTGSRPRPSSSGRGRMRCWARARDRVSRIWRPHRPRRSRLDNSARAGRGRFGSATEVYAAFGDNPAALEQIPAADRRPPGRSTAATGELAAADLRLRFDNQARATENARLKARELQSYDERRELLLGLGDRGFAYRRSVGCCWHCRSASGAASPSWPWSTS